MRIVAGEFSSRNIKSVPGQNTRPTSDKVKGAVFSSLGGAFSGGVILDCYSGTGNIALEALSRGMDEAICVDRDRKAIQVIKENVKALGVEDRVQVIQGDIFHVLENITEKVDLVYIDPPYQKEQNIKLIKKIEDLDLLVPEGRIVVESLSEQEWPENLCNLVKTREKNYRNTKITYYRKVVTL